MLFSAMAKYTENSIIDFLCCMYIIILPYMIIRYFSERRKQLDLELSLKKEGKMLREIGFKVCGHRICMIKTPNVCGICGRKYKTEKPTTKKSKYVESDSDSDSESEEESDKEVAPVSNRAASKRKPVAKKSSPKNMVILVVELSFELQ